MILIIMGQYLAYAFFTVNRRSIFEVRKQRIKIYGNKDSSVDLRHSHAICCVVGKYADIRLCPEYGGKDNKE